MNSQVSAVISLSSVFENPKVPLSQFSLCLNNFEMWILSNEETAAFKCYFTKIRSSVSAQITLETCKHNSGCWENSAFFATASFLCSHYLPVWTTLSYTVYSFLRKQELVLVNLLEFTIDQETSKPAEGIYLIKLGTTFLEKHTLMLLWSISIRL